MRAGDRRVVRFSQPGLPAGGRELAGRRFPKRMSSRWSPGQPSVFRSRWGITKAISESGIDSLVRLVGRRGLQLCAGRIRGSNVASGWGTPRRSAGIQARAPTVSHDRPVRADRSNDKSTSATAHAMAADAQPLLRLWSTTDAAVPIGAYWNPGFGAEASITLPWRPVTATETLATTCEKCVLSGTSQVEPTGFEPVTSCLQSRRSKAVFPAKPDNLHLLPLCAYPLHGLRLVNDSLFAEAVLRPRPRPSRESTPGPLRCSGGHRADCSGCRSPRGCFDDEQAGRGGRSRT